MKNDLRIALKEKRARMPPLKRRRDSKKIALNILHSPELNLGTKIGLYFASKSEVNTKYLITALVDQGKKIFLPVVKEEKIFFAEYDPRITTMTKNRYGISEPSKKDTIIVSPASLDTAFFPIVGYNSNLHRIGMGGGLYDRSFKGLKKKSPIRVGLAFSFQQVSFEPERHDVPLLAICTEDGVIFRNENK